MRKLAVIAAFLFLCGAARGQRVELQIESRNLQEGETVELNLICTNTGDPETPQFEAPKGLDLRLLNPSPMRSSMVSIINGRRTETTTYTYNLRLTGVKAGAYMLPPITVPAGGTTYQTDPIAITVVAPAESAVKEGDQIVFARVSAQPVSLYVTQTVQATLTLGIRKFERDGQVVELGNMLQLVDANGSELSVFGSRFTSSEVTLVDSTGKRHAYLVYRQNMELTADQVGTMTIGPVFFKVNYPVTLRRSLFGGLEVAQSRREIARAPAVEIEVKGAPDEGRPADFTGAIGQYELAVSAKPARLELGQPVTLTIAIKGDPIEGIAGPDLRASPELAARFDFSSEESAGEKEGNAKVFRRAIFPRREGEQTIPAISWSYFHPGTQRYVTLTSPPIPIVVDPSSSPEAVTDAPVESTSGTTRLTRTLGGISPNVVDAGLVLATHDLHVPAGVLGAGAALPPLLCLVAVLVSRREARMRGDANYLRRRTALRTARKRMRQAGPEADVVQQCHHMATTVSGFIADRFGLPPGAMVPEEARRVVAERTGNESLAKEVAKLLADCDAARFAPVTTREAGNMHAQARALIDELEKAAR